MAHQRVLYEQFEHINQQAIPIQKCLIPQTIELQPADAILVQSILPDLYLLGYELEEFGTNTFIIQGIASDVKPGNEKASIEKIIDAYKFYSSEIKLDKREKLIRTLAMQKAIPYGQKLSSVEMQELFQNLLRCEQPQLSPAGKKIFVKLGHQDIAQLIHHA